MYFIQHENLHPIIYKIAKPLNFDRLFSPLSYLNFPCFSFRFEFKNPKKKPT